MRWRSFVGFWQALTSGLAREQARNFNQRRRGGAVGFFRI
jgi:hypothetical protein